MECEWWEEPNNILYEIENEEWGLTHLMHRLVEGVHHYAIVRWAWGNCTLIFEFYNGRKSEC